MKYAVTVVSPEGYPHSEAFRDVAETVHRGLLTLGLDSVLTTRLGLPERRHVVLGSNLLARHGAAPAAGSILYNLEQIEPGSPWLDAALVELFRRHPVWDYSRRNIERLAAFGVYGAARDALSARARIVLNLQGLAKIAL